MADGKDEGMNLKLLGAVLVLVSCGGFGFSLVLKHKSAEKAIRQLISVIDYMECELQYRLTPLPELCRAAAGECSGEIRKFLCLLTEELDNQVLPEVRSCMHAALAKVPQLPRQARTALLELGQVLGRFDLSGQLKGLGRVREICDRELTVMAENRDVRLRSYQTLGLCAGAALVILFI